MSSDIWKYMSLYVSLNICVWLCEGPPGQPCRFKMLQSEGVETKASLDWWSSGIPPACGSFCEKFHWLGAGAVAPFPTSLRHFLCSIDSRGLRGKQISNADANKLTGRERKSIANIPTINQPICCSVWNDFSYANPKEKKLGGSGSLLGNTWGYGFFLRVLSGVLQDLFVPAWFKLTFIYAKLCKSL